MYPKNTLGQCTSSAIFAELEFTLYSVLHECIAYIVRQHGEYLVVHDMLGTVLNEESAYKRGGTGTGNFLFPHFCEALRAHHTNKMAAPPRRRKKRSFSHDIQQ